MKKTISLLKILIRSTFGISKLQYKAAKNKIEYLKLIGFALLMVMAFSPILAGYIIYMIGAYEALNSIGQPGAILTAGVVLSCTMTLFFGFFYVISIYYFSNDIEHLVTLPLHPSQILNAKFIVAMLAEYMTELPIVLPVIIIYGVKSALGILYWVYSIAAVLIIPIIPLCIVSIIAILVMRVTNIGRRRDFYRIIGGIAAVVLILAVQFYVQNTAMSGDPEKLMSTIFSGNGIINTIAKAFPPAAWVSEALIQYAGINGLIYLVLFIVVSFIFLAVFSYLGEKLFFGGYIGSDEASGDRKSLSDEKLLKETAYKGRISAIFWRELKIVNRVPVFFINNVLPIVLVPIIFILMFLMSKNSGLDMLMSAVNTNGRYITALVVTGISIFTSIANMTPATAISREGAQFYVSKYIPVEPKEQILGKICHSLSLMLSGDLLIIITLGVFLRLPASVMLLCFIISGIASLPVTEIGLIIDLAKPVLVWDNPQRAVKQNVNGVLSMFLNMLWIGIIFLFTGFIVHSLITASVVLSALFGVIGLILYRVLISYGSKRYYSIEP